MSSPSLRTAGLRVVVAGFVLLAAAAAAQPAPDASFTDGLTVVAASRQSERLVEAPAAVSTVSEATIARQAPHGQLPRLLAHAPGVELVQSGVFDFNLNVRGMNAFVNRRVLTLIDGRDPSLPVFSGGQEWAAISFPLDELARVELVRGPGASLYGAGAYNGVLDLVTRPASSPPGGRLRLTGGELATRRADLRWRSALGEHWWLKAVGSYLASDGFSRSRTAGVEYAPGVLPTEVVPLRDGGVEVASGGLRLDGALGGGTLSLEAGTAAIAGTTVLTGIGRTQRNDVDRPWARLAWDTARWSILAYHTGRTSSDETSLASGARIDLDSASQGVEVERRGDAWGGRLDWVGGAFWGRQEVDSAGPDGVQTVFDRPHETERWAVFGQGGVELLPRLEGVLSLRWDDATLHEGRLSPRAALVWSPAPAHALRLAYAEAFQSPSLAEHFLRVPVGPAVDLSGLEAALAPVLGGVTLGFDAVPILALGNDDLAVEEVKALELGYTAVASDGFLTINLFRDELSGFVSDLLFQVGTTAGRLNPDFGPYEPPAALSPAARATVLAALAAALPPGLFAALANDTGGAPVFALLSYTNFGAVTTAGVELAASAARGPWSLDVAYTYLDFELDAGLAESPLGPNAPEHHASLAVAYRAGDWDAALRYRWSDAYSWLSGIFAGPVPSFAVVDLSAARQLDERWRLGVEVANLLDDAHYEVFGGDLLGRQALAYVTLEW